MTVALHPLPLKECSAGDAVSTIQSFLATLKLYSGQNIDGVFGPKTKEAVSLKFDCILYQLLIRDYQF